LTTRIALCVSGGGFRATLFHLGAARRLYELGLLQRLDTISSVSGGSIFAGVLAISLPNEDRTRVS
jgi:NTE family protein